MAQGAKHQTTKTITIIQITQLVMVNITVAIRIGNLDSGQCANNIPLVLMGIHASSIIQDSLTTIIKTMV
jgi:hypothetical protein